MKFKEFGLDPLILKALGEMDYAVPTKIQTAAIPIVLKGRDILGTAQTGTGKTAAFALPILQKLLKQAKKNSGIKALILTPTRELALQIQENFVAYGKYLAVKSVVIYGGVNQNTQVQQLNRHPEVLIATPGRLLDLMGQGIIRLSEVKTLVLDEADRMLDMGFIKDVRRIISALPVQRQTLFFSATMPKEIFTFGHSILKQPEEIAVAPVSSPAQTVRQSVCFVEKEDKPELLISLLKEKTAPLSLVFTRTKHRADRLVKKLKRTGIEAAAIHGDKSQNARQRALNDFKLAKIKVLIATDIVARGIDIEELPLVINYELPDVPETYVHRIGRTGRAGKEGVALSFCDSEEKQDLKQIQKLIGFQMSVEKDLRNIQLCN